MASSGGHAYDRVKQSRSAWERVLLMIPGYRGYRGRDLIRDTDQLVRDAVALELRKALGALKDAYKSLVNGGNDVLASEVDSAVRILDRLQQAIAHASRGYSGRWDGAKILDAQLDRAIEFDDSLLDGARRIGSDIGAFRAETSAKLLETVRSDLEALDRTFIARKQVMIGIEELGKSEGRP